LRLVDWWLADDFVGNEYATGADAISMPRQSDGIGANARRTHSSFLPLPARGIKPTAD
jgi:hypothetical protein